MTYPVLHVRGQSTSNCHCFECARERLRAPGADAVRHELKTWPKPFQAMLDGIKTFEVRKADRPYALGDVLLLREWKPVHDEPCDWYCDIDEQQREHEDIKCKLCKRNYTQPLAGEYTGRVLIRRVVYMIKPGEWDVPSQTAASQSIVVMGIRPDAETP